MSAFVLCVLAGAACLGAFAGYGLRAWQGREFDRALSESLEAMRKASALTREAADCFREVHKKLSCGKCEEPAKPAAVGIKGAIRAARRRAR